MPEEPSDNSSEVKLDTTEVVNSWAQSTESKAANYEILGETYAKFESFENGWNPYSTFRDVDKVDLILIRTEAGRFFFREVQSQTGKALQCRVMGKATF